MTETVDIQDDPQYEFVLKKVLWDEDEAVVMKKLTVNGVSKDRAVMMYQVARRERIQLLRADGLKKLLQGSVLAIVVAGLYWLLNWHQFQITRFVIELVGFVCAAGVGLGIVQAVRGIAEWLFAARKRGSVAD